MDKSLLEVILSTCNKTEIPPKPSKNEVINILIESFLQAILEILLIPLVISKNPVNSGSIKEGETCIKLKNGLAMISIICVIPLDFKIEIIEEKMTTNPPISKIDFMLLIILSDKISPKLEKEAGVFVFAYVLEVEGCESQSFAFFQKRKIIPTDKEASKCVINSKRPIMVFRYSKIPTEPIMNKGPELLVKLKSLSHSSFVQIFSFLKLVAIFAPMGYPLIIPMIKAKAPSPLILNKGFIKRFKMLPI